jgi:uncharacterized Zn-binding protein involved in type VI secretion
METSGSFLNGLEARSAAVSIAKGGAPSDGGSMWDTVTGTAKGAVQNLSGIVGPMLPPNASHILSIAQPLLNSGLSAILSGSITGQEAGAMGGLGGLAKSFLPGGGVAGGSVLDSLKGALSPESLLSGGVVTGLAGQFLPPQAAQALSLAQGFMKGGILGVVPGLVSRFLPPELQGVFSAVMQTGMIQSAIASLRPPKPDGENKDLDIQSEAGPSGGMAPFAARVGDAHVCPMSDGPKPHVGGPILPPCCPKVIIGNMPAARVGDKALCAGPPDSIIMGEITVLIGGANAARLGDPTAHGGIITSGFATVLIGKSLAHLSLCIMNGCKDEAAFIDGATENQ